MWCWHFIRWPGRLSERRSCLRTRPTSNASKAMMPRSWAFLSIAYPVTPPGRRVLADSPTTFSATFILKAKWQKLTVLTARAMAFRSARSSSSIRKESWPSRTFIASQISRTTKNLRRLAQFVTSNQAKGWRPARLPASALYWSKYL